MFSCFGLFKKRRHDDEEREPLLPRYRGDTALQARLREKLHSYQMLRALGKGYMPSNEQLITNLRTLLTADVLSPHAPENLSDSGHALVLNVRLLITQFIELLQHKNADDQIQDFIWFLAKSRISVDVHDVAERASRAKSKADTAAAYKSLQTVGSLLLTNSDFRLFLSDLTTVGREVFRDTAFALSDVSKDVGKKVEPSKEEQEAVKHPNGGASRSPPSKADLGHEVADISSTVADGAARVADEAGSSLADHITGDEKDTLLHRLKQAVLKLRERRDYSDSVSTLSLLIRRYMLAYSHAVADTAQAVEEDVHVNPEADQAMRNFWGFITSFGNPDEWKEVERSFHAVMDHAKTDPNFDDMVRRIGNFLQDMLTEPDFFDHAEERFQEVRAKSRELTDQSSIRDDVDALLDHLQKAIRSVLDDAHVNKLLRTSRRILAILSPSHRYTNTELVSDALNVFIPLAVNAVQYVPIPRLEVSTPAMDLLLENLIIEPGRTVNHSSFLPYKLNVTTRNDVEVRKARNLATYSSVTTVMRIAVSGLSLAADDVGYWLRMHSGLLRFIDTGIVGLHLDERGVDIAVDVEIGRERLEQVLTLRGVRVRIHRLTYSLAQSKMACLAWCLKPVVRPLLRKALEVAIARGIADACHAANREIIYARERLRATRIASPQDLWTYLRAIAARLAPREDPDTYTRVGVTQPGGGVFKGVYAPGSLVKVWNEEGALAGQRAFQYEREGWRNDIFDVTARASSVRRVGD